MKKRSIKFMGRMCFIMFSVACVELYAQSAVDSLKMNNNNSGIPNSGNTLQPNNGPEFPHSAFPVQSTDPGPLFHGPSGQMFDSIPDPQKPHS